MTEKKEIHEAEEVEDKSHKERFDMVEVEAKAVDITPMSLIQQAQQGNASIEQMQQLFDLQLRWEENEAKKAYHQAVAKFKSEAITILKDKHVSFPTSKGKTEYDHARLGTIVKTVVPYLSKHGLSHRWDFDQPNGQVQVTCILSHELGHSQKTTLMAAKDDSGGKNSIQAISSAVSYLERYTFLGITGLAAEDQDDDGRGTDETPVITESQLADLEGLILDVKVDVPKLITYLNNVKKMSIEALEDLPAEHYNFTCQAIETKRGKE